MNDALKATPTRWWGTHKRNIIDWVQCQTLMTTLFLAQVEGCGARYIGRSCPKDNMRSCEEA
jgi:hypothetical protein